MGSRLARDWLEVHHHAFGLSENSPGPDFFERFGMQSTGVSSTLHSATDVVKVDVSIAASEQKRK